MGLYEYFLSKVEEMRASALPPLGESPSSEELEELTFEALEVTEVSARTLVEVEELR